MTDKNVTEYNRRQWNALADAGIVCSRPILNITADRAHELVDGEGLLGELAGRRVLCLANSGGQQSVAFAFLGAEVTVFDHSAKQLASDRLAADHYGFNIRTVEGDIRDLTDSGTENLILFLRDTRSTMSPISKRSSTVWPAYSDRVANMN